MWVLPPVNSPLFTNFDDSQRCIALSCNVNCIAFSTSIVSVSATLRCDATFFIVKRDELHCRYNYKDVLIQLSFLYISGISLSHFQL